jgi:DNA-binding transcriptional LysR family regulator
VSPGGGLGVPSTRVNCGEDDALRGVVAVPLEDPPSRHVFAAVLPAAHRAAAIEAMLARLREAAATRLAA